MTDCCRGMGVIDDKGDCIYSHYGDCCHPNAELCPYCYHGECQFLAQVEFEVTDPPEERNEVGYVCEH
jgi:hypothetical protein